MLRAQGLLSFGTVPAPPYIELIGMTLVNKTTHVLIAQLRNTSSSHCIVHSLPKVKSLSTLFIRAASKLLHVATWWEFYDRLHSLHALKVTFIILFETDLCLFWAECQGAVGHSL